MALWNSSFETGNTNVDKDHKELFELVEGLLQTATKSKKETVKEAIDFLAGYVVRHFGMEEGLMAESSFPHTDVHKKQHADFLAEVGKMVEKFESDGFALGAKEDSNLLHFNLEVNKTIVGWLTAHVMGSDRALADHYRAWTEKSGVVRRRR